MIELIDEKDVINPKGIIKVGNIFVKTMDIEIMSIMEDVPIEWISDVPDYCGAYIITTKLGKSYVGSSKRLYTRLMSHIYSNIHTIEPIESVSFYFTKDHIDSRILEYVLIRELRPELNIDTLDRNKDNVSYTEELLRSNDNIRVIFERLRERIHSLDNIREVIRKSWIIYQVGMDTFCGIEIKKNHLLINLKTDDVEFNDPYGLCSKICNYMWTYNRCIKLDDFNKVIMVFDIIKQSYEFTIKTPDIWRR